MKNIFDDEDFKNSLLSCKEADGFIHRIKAKQPEAFQILTALAKKAKIAEEKKGNFIPKGFYTVFIKNAVLRITEVEYKTASDKKLTHEQEKEKLLSFKTPEGIIKNFSRRDRSFYNHLRSTARDIKEKSKSKVSVADIMKLYIYQQTGCQYENNIRFENEKSLLKFVSDLAKQDGCIDKLRDDEDAFESYRKQAEKKDMSVYAYNKNNNFYLSSGSIDIDVIAYAKFRLASEYSDKNCEELYSDKYLYHVIKRIKNNSPEYCEGTISDMLFDWNGYIYPFEPLPEFEDKKIYDEEYVLNLASRYHATDGILHTDKHSDLGYGLSVVAASHGKSRSQLAKDWEMPINNRENEVLENKSLTSLKYNTVEELRELERIKTIIETPVQNIETTPTAICY